MNDRQRSYRCEVCKWRGRAEPLDAGDASPCPQCGVYLYPLPWFQVYGVPLLLIAATVALVAAAGYLL